MSMNTFQKIIDKIKDVFSSTDRKRRAPDQIDYYQNNSKKLRLGGYNEDDEYSDTDMDFFESKSTNKRRTLNQKRQSIGTQFNHLSNGLGHASTSHRKSNVMPDDDVVFLSQAPPSTSTFFLTRLKPLRDHEPNAHSTLRSDVPPLVPLATITPSTSRFNNTTRSTRYSYTPAMHNNITTNNNVKPPVPKIVPINTFNAMNGGRNAFMSSSLLKQSNGGTSAFKGIDTIERMSRGHKIADMGRNKSPSNTFGNSVFNMNRDKNGKKQYYELLKQVCPDIYSKNTMNYTNSIDLTTEELPKGSSTKLVDLTTEDDKDDTSKTTRSGTPTTDHVNSLLERLSTRDVFDDKFTSNFKTQKEEERKLAKSKIEQEERRLCKLRNETDAGLKVFHERYRGIPLSMDQLIQRIADGEEEEEEVEEVQYPALTADHKTTIKYALHGGPAHEVIINKFNLRITRNDLNTLVETVWLNDEVINFYMNLIMERSEHRTDLPKSYCFNTFFIPTVMQRGHGGVKRWTRKVDIFSYDLLPVPVHVGGIHWCMAVIRMKEKIIRYYDSMGNPNQPVLDALERYLIDEAMDKKKIVLDTRDWIKESIRECPQQRNGSDCGVFSCMNAEHLTRNAPLSFSQNDMPYFRHKMILEIATGNLIT